MRIGLLIIPFACLLPIGCGEKADAAPKEPPSAVQPGVAAGAMVATTAVHDMICGCALEDVGHCGNYIKVGEEHLVLVGEFGLDPMEFCKKEGVKAEVTGKVEEGKFVATAYKVTDPGKDK